MLLPLLVFVAWPLWSAPLEKVTLQLKWFHQFQFAGYYAAIEQGYYAQEGLDVRLIPRDKTKNNILQVINGEAEYGIADSSLLYYRAKGYPVKLLASIYQHSPLIFIARRDSEIISPFEMRGKRLMTDKNLDDSPLEAMLTEAGIREGDYTRIPQSFNCDDLITGKIDAMEAYSTDEPYYFEQRHFPITIINPLNYGIDFYGDNLFTTEKEIHEHPERVKKIIRATLKGWRYALTHQDEIIDLILRKYRSPLTRDHLRHEADLSRQMILPELIELGYTNKERFAHIAEIYSRIGMISARDAAKAVESIIYKQDEPDNLLTRFIPFVLVAGGIVIAIIVFQTIFNLRLRRLVDQKTSQLKIQLKRAQESEKRYHTLFKSSMDAIMTAEPPLWRFTSGNPATLRLFGISDEAEFVTYTPAQLSPPFQPDGRSSADKAKEVIDITLHNGSHVFEWVHKKIDGTLFPATVLLTRVTIKGKTLILSTVRNISKEKAAAEELRVMATTDSLTGLANRRHFLTRLESEVARTQRYEANQATLIMIDLDHFKQINDTYGHATGDAVLRAFADLLGKMLRKSDLAGRMGGEEFAILLPQTPLEQAETFAERLRSLIESTTVKSGKHDVRFTISIGVTAILRYDTDADGPLARADIALYRAKTEGRNRIRTNI